MRTKRKCIPGPRPISILAALLVSLFLGAPLLAQSSSLAERLSPNTIFYVQWRGAAFVADAEKKNHLLQLIEDPQLAPAWLVLANKLQTSMAKPGASVPAPGLFDLISLTSNSAVFGMTENPDSSKTPVAKGAPSRVGVFLVYDAKGKADLILKLKAMQKASSKAAPSVTNYDFEGTSVEVQTTGESAAYTAQTGGFFIFASEKGIINDLVTRFHGDTKPATSVTGLPEYKEVQKYIGSDAAIEYFARVPDFKEWIPADSKNQAVIKMVDNLHLDRIHAMGGGWSVSGEAARFHGAVIGDTSPGSLFDFVGESKPIFVTQPLVGANPSFSFTRLDWAAPYQLIIKATEGNLTPQQAAGLGAAEGMAKGYLGMSIADALSLFSGEFASTYSFDDDGTTQQMFALTIQKPNDVLRMLRAVVGTMIVAEDSSGDATFLDLAYPYKDPANGTQRKKFFYLGVTPHMIVAAQRKKLVKDAITRLSSSTSTAAATGIFANSEYLQMRSALPEKLSGLSGSDLRQIPWDKILASYFSQVEEASKQAKDTTPPDLSWLKLIKPEVISRHVHTSIGGWWKDSNGIYFDSYLQ
jgi:hypothetical protein